MANSAIVSANALDTSLLSLSLLGDVAAPTNLAQAAIRETYQWLGREGVSRADYELAVVQTAGVAYPNESGLAVTESILRTKTPNFIAGGLALMLPGAIGRRMAQTVEHAWMVTTAVVVSRFRSLGDIPRLLMEMILLGEKMTVPRQSPKAGIIRAKLMKVLSKFVDSIALNVVNQGHDVTDFPVELRGQCQYHLTGERDFAEIATALQKPEKRYVLFCERFEADIILWILNHFDGTLEVTLSRKKVFIRHQPHSARHLDIMVEKSCSDASCQMERPKMELFELLSSGAPSSLNKSSGFTPGKSGDKPESWLPPARRRALYDIHWELAHITEYQSSGRQGRYQHKMLQDTEIKRTREIAKGVLRFIMALPLSPIPYPDRGHQMEFEVFQGHDDDDDGSAVPALRLGHLFKRSPIIVHDFGEDVHRDTASHVFIAPHMPGLLGTWTDFPEIQTFLDDIGRQCGCLTCGDAQSSRKDTACLRTVAANCILIHIGDGIADGFGISDASGLSATQEHFEHLRRVLDALVRGSVKCEDWAKTALMTALGTTKAFQFERRVSHDDDDDTHHGNGNLLGAQVGSTLIVASWLDMRVALKLDRIFSMDVIEGRITGVEEECTLIMSYSVDLEDSPEGEHVVWDRLIARIWGQDAAPSKVEIQQAILDTRSACRLLTIAQAGNVMRLIDPSCGAVTFVRRASELAPCQHSSEALQETSTANAELHQHAFEVYTFAETLRCWGESMEGARPVHAMMTEVLDSPLKVNLALAVAVGPPCLILGGSLPCCLRCLTDFTHTFREKDECAKIVVCQEPGRIAY